MQYSIVNHSNLEDISLRIDAEFYHPLFIELQNKIENFGSSSLVSIGGKLDCSAFYPSITDYYNFDQQGIPFLRVSELQKGLLKITDDTAFLPESILKKYESNIAVAYPNDILIAKGGNSLAKIGLLTDQYEKYSVSRDLIVLRTNKLKEINKYFLWLFLHSESGKDSMLRTASQTGQPHLTIKSINHLKIPKISNNFQNLCEAIFKKSVDLQKFSEALYIQAEGLLFSELDLIDWKPEHKLTFVKKFSNTVAAERCDAEHFQLKYDEMDKRLRGFKTKTIGDVFDMFGSSSFKYSAEKDEVAVIKTKNLTIDEISLNNIENYISEKEFDKFKSGKKVKYRDVLLASMGVGSLGKANIFLLKKSNCTVDSTLKIFREKQEKEVLAEVLSLWINTLFMQELLYKYVVGSTGIINIYDDDILNLPIPILSTDGQKKIAQKIVDSQKSLLKSKTSLKKARKAIEVVFEKGEIEAKKYLNQ